MCCLPSGSLILLQTTADTELMRCSTESLHCPSLMDTVLDGLFFEWMVLILVEEFSQGADQIDESLSHGLLFVVDMKKRGVG